MDARGRDDGEEEIMHMIYAGGQGGEDAGGEAGEDFSSQFLNDYGDGAEIERRDEGPSTNSGEVY
jgi:hypothetical protein